MENLEGIAAFALHRSAGRSADAPRLAPDACRQVRKGRTERKRISGCPGDARHTPGRASGLRPERGRCGHGAAWSEIYGG